MLWLSLRRKHSGKNIKIRELLAQAFESRCLIYFVTLAIAPSRLTYMYTNFCHFRDDNASRFRIDMK